MEPTCPKPGRVIEREKEGKRAVQNSGRPLLITWLFSPHLQFLKINKDLIGWTGMILSMIFTR